MIFLAGTGTNLVTGTNLGTGTGEICRYRYFPSTGKFCRYRYRHIIALNTLPNIKNTITFQLIHK
jgi:hypothetical protein